MASRPQSCQEPKGNCSWTSHPNTWVTEQQRWQPAPVGRGQNIRGSTFGGILLSVSHLGIPTGQVSVSLVYGGGDRLRRGEKLPKWPASYTEAVLQLRWLARKSNSCRYSAPHSGSLQPTLLLNGGLSADGA